MKVSLFLPVVTLREKTMPFYLSSIGEARFQTIVHRPLGIEDHQFLYTVRGAGECFINGESFELKKGSLFFLPSSYPHEYHALTDDWETKYFTFNGSGVKDFFDFEPWIANMAEKLDFPEYHRRLYEMKQDIALDTKLSVYLYSMLLELRDCLEFSSAPSRKQRDIITAVLHGFSEQPESTLSDIAGRFGISEEHFCRVFKKHTGYRPFEYMNLIKLQKAKELLSNTNMDIKDIAAHIGFESHSYFSLLFKKYVGESPSQYRRGTKHS
ncbi:MAG: helix-turn-helix domain-containing protein [Clostridia bacterium]|nr:helix-turn-helix domain-containing protein [Clostridia bacterium]